MSEIAQTASIFEQLVVGTQCVALRGRDALQFLDRFHRTKFVRLTSHFLQGQCAACALAAELTRCCSMQRFNFFACRQPCPRSFDLYLLPLVVVALICMLAASHTCAMQAVSALFLGTKGDATVGADRTMSEFSLPAAMGCPSPENKGTNHSGHWEPDHRLIEPSGHAIAA